MRQMRTGRPARSSARLVAGGLFDVEVIDRLCDLPRLYAAWVRRRDEEDARERARRAAQGYPEYARERIAEWEEGIRQYLANPPGPATRRDTIVRKRWDRHILSSEGRKCSLGLNYLAMVVGLPEARLEQATRGLDCRVDSGRDSSGIPKAILYRVELARWARKQSREFRRHGVGRAA